MTARPLPLLLPFLLLASCAQPQQAPVIHLPAAPPEVVVVDVAPVAQASGVVRDSARDVSASVNDAGAATDAAQSTSTRLLDALIREAALAAADAEIHKALEDARKLDLELTQVRTALDKAKADAAKHREHIDALTEAVRIASEEAAASKAWGEDVLRRWHELRAVAENAVVAHSKSSADLDAAELRIATLESKVNWWRWRGGGTWAALGGLAALFVLRRFSIV